MANILQQAVKNNGEWMSLILTKMFDLLLIFFHEGFMLFLLLFFRLLSSIRDDVYNALWRSDRGKRMIITDYVSDSLKENVIPDITEKFRV